MNLYSNATVIATYTSQDGNVLDVYQDGTASFTYSGESMTSQLVEDPATVVRLLCSTGAGTLTRV